MHALRASLLACVLAAVAVTAIPGQSGGQPWPANVRVNQDHDGNQQAETSLAVNPLDPLHLVTVFWEVIAYDPQGPGSREKRLNWAWSRDGGRTWKSRRFENGVYSSDPSIVADRQGNFYIETILVPHFPYQNDVSLGILKSTDGGETFVKTADVGLGRFMDKPFMTIDPATDALYLVWTDFGPHRGPNDIRIFFAASTDHGVTFTPPRQISAEASFGSWVTASAGTAGEIYATWSTVFYSQRIWFDRSSDGGRTWLSKDVRVADIPSGGSRPGSGFGWPTVAVDRSGGPHHGRVYVAWPRYSLGIGAVDLAWSDDRGDHWSQPVRVDDFEAAGDSHGLAWVVVDDRGGVHVTYRLLRPDPGGTLRAQYLASSTDGGATFGPNIRVSDGLYPNRIFNGDYDQPATAGNRLYAIWADARFGDNDVFTQSIDLDDYDEDGILNEHDNCPGTPNAGQADTDGDLVGDACDNCPLERNTNQSDLDRNGVGDVCEEVS
jgi:hypothetical protein